MPQTLPASIMTVSELFVKDQLFFVAPVEWQIIWQIASVLMRFDHVARRIVNADRIAAGR
jgi:hypothetical protein